MTEYTDRTINGLGVLFYDGSCRLCVKWAGRLHRMFGRQGLELRPFEEGADQDEMFLRLNDGREFGGADAVWVLAGRVWWGLPWWGLGYLPGVLPLMRAGYRRIAQNRHCIGGKCELDLDKQRLMEKPAWLWRVSFLLVIGIWYLGQSLPAWGLMWSLAAGQYLAFKVMALSQVRTGDWWGRLMFLFFWPGMDAGTFLAKRKIDQPAGWKLAVAFVLLGAVLVGGVSARVEGPVLQGWVSMLGLIALLHFGVFGLLANFWQSRGYGARAIMDAPWRAVSLADFWGRRWNRAFSDVARVMVFRPLSRKWGSPMAMLAGFVFSGLAHEVVITLPAGGGYGMALLYFVAQAVGVMIERCLGLKGVLARIWTFLFVLGPAYWLFSPIFMERVIVPFVEMIGK